MPGAAAMRQNKPETELDTHNTRVVGPTTQETALECRYGCTKRTIRLEKYSVETHGEKKKKNRKWRLQYPIRCYTRSLPTGPNKECPNSYIILSDDVVVTPFGGRSIATWVSSTNVGRTATLGFINVHAPDPSL